jgi:hypothetical protein
MGVVAGLSLSEVTVSVQHLYRDGERIAEEVGSPLHDGGWFPGTGVGHKVIDLDGVRVNVVSVVDYRASRTSDLGYAVYEAARHGTALLRLTFMGDLAAWDGAPPARRTLTECYRRADGHRVPEVAALELQAGPTCTVRLLQGSGAPGASAWSVGLGTDVDWISAAEGLGLGSASGAELTSVTYQPRGITFRASDPAALVRVRRD